MDDIVTRLRNWHTDHDSAFPRPIDLEAADEIESLRIDRDKWKALSEGVAKAITNEGSFPSYHRSIMKRHRSQWKTLWNRIDLVLKAVDDE